MYNNNQTMIFYGTKEVANILGCSIPTAREVMRSKNFPLVKVGRAYKVYAPALEEWARGHNVC